LPDAQGRIVNLFVMLPEADGAFLEAATGCPDSLAGDHTRIVDFGAGGLIENLRLLLHCRTFHIGRRPRFRRIL
jgi:hypothetical protein